MHLIYIFSHEVQESSYRSNTPSIGTIGRFFYSREATVLLNEQENFTEQEN